VKTGAAATGSTFDPALGRIPNVGFVGATGVRPIGKYSVVSRVHVDDQPAGGGRGACRLGVPVGAASQPATQEVKVAYGEHLPREATVSPIDDGAGRGYEEPSAADGRSNDAGPDAARPIEDTVPQAVPPRPAGRSTAAVPSGRRVVAPAPAPYSFEPLPPVTWGRRLRSTLGVLLVVTAVGMALAASLAVLAAFISHALEGAVS
jgi:hypothetical protein